jgi:hypothetical protein
MNDGTINKKKDNFKKEKDQGDNLWQFNIGRIGS